MSRKRIIDHATDLTLRSDDYILKDSATNDTKKITPEAFVEGALDNYLAGYVSGLDSTSASSDSDIFYTVVDGVQKKVSKSTILSADRTARATAEGTIVANFASPYSTTTQYAVGDYCIKDLVLYKCISPTSGTWDSSKWTQVTALDLTSGVASDLADEIEARQSADETLQGEIDELPVDVQVNGGSLVNEDNIAVLDSLVAYGEASGEIATFSDGSDLAMKSLKVAIEPQQDLHGYDAPWVGGAGKNKFAGSYYNNYMSENNGVFTNIESDTQSVFRFIVQAFNGSDLIASSSQEVISSQGRYYVSITIPSPGTSLKIKHNGSSKDIGINCQFTATGTFTISLNVTKTNPSTVGGLEFKDVQIESGSQMTSYAPYSNICPISGWDECNVNLASKNLSKSQTNNSVLCSAKKGVTYTLSFEGNVGANIKKNTNSGEVVIWGTQLPLTFTADEDFNIFLNAWNANISNIQVEVGNQATAYEAYNGTTYIVQLGDTYYGAILDVTTGILVVDRKYLTIDDFNSSSGSGTSAGGLHWFDVTNKPKGKLGNKNICSICGYIQNGWTSTITVMSVDISETIPVRIYDSSESLSDFKDKYPNLQLVYELATPQTFQLTPTQVKSLLGANNVWADTGNILEAKYVRDLTTTINYILEQLNS